MNFLDKRASVILLSIMTTLQGNASFAANPSVPPSGWLEAGSEPSDYEMIGDRATTYSGKASGCIRGGEKSRGFGTLMQMFRAENYRGKRVRMSAYAKSVNVQKWAGLWMRVDHDEKSVSFDNMRNRPLKGTTEWKKYEIVLDVPMEATKIAFGVLLNGQGTVWVDEFRFEEVPRSVPTTDTENTPKNPRNLSFEE